MEGALESGLRVAEQIAVRDQIVVKRGRKARRARVPKSAAP
jgi:hypothetical protein